MEQVQLVSYATILDAEDLLAEYAAECSIPEIGTVNPQPEMYAAMERAGAVRMFGAFYEGKLVGLASVLITVLPHYGQKAATIESLFVAKSFRSKGLGPELMRAVEAHAKEAGCKAILYSAPSGGKLERLLSKRKDMRRTNSVFCRPL